MFIIKLADHTYLSWQNKPTQKIMMTKKYEKHIFAQRALHKIKDNEMIKNASIIKLEEI